MVEFHSAGGNIKANTFLLSKQTYCCSEFWWKGNQVSLLWHIICHFPWLLVYISESCSLSDQYFHDPPLSLCTLFLCVAYVCFRFPIVETKLDACHQWLSTSGVTSCREMNTYGRCTAQFIFMKWTHSYNWDLDQETEHCQHPRNLSYATIQTLPTTIPQFQGVITILILKP